MSSVLQCVLMIEFCPSFVDSGMLLVKLNTVCNERFLSFHART